MIQNAQRTKNTYPLKGNIKIDPIEAYKKYVVSLSEALEKINEDEIVQMVSLFKRVQSMGRTVFIVGNGGSASTASHWATDLGKGLHHRSNEGVKALSLADNIAWISAAANDIDYDSIFSDQLRAHATEGDLLVAISASGNSPNILKAINQAKSMGMITLSVVGFDGGAAKELCDYTVHIPTDYGRYGIAEDVQLILNHFLCDYLAGELE